MPEKSLGSFRIARWPDAIRSGSYPARSASFAVSYGTRTLILDFGERTLVETLEGAEGARDV
jgi:hypothetical protein